MPFRGLRRVGREQVQHRLECLDAHIVLRIQCQPGDQLGRVLFGKTTDRPRGSRPDIVGAIGCQPGCGLRFESAEHFRQHLDRADAGFCFARRVEGGLDKMAGTDLPGQRLPPRARPLGQRLRCI